jgi:hypothetical protein
VRIGRYHSTRVTVWSDLRDCHPHAKLTYFALTTGETANMAGIGPLYVEALERETGLLRSELESALAELSKRGLIVIADGVCWIKDKLRNDPAREGDPEITNEKHRKGVETLLGSLPRTNVAVRKFRAFYKFTRQAPSEGLQRGQAGASKGNAEVGSEGV